MGARGSRGRPLLGPGLHRCLGAVPHRLLPLVPGACVCDDLHRHPQGHPNRHPQGHPRHLRTPAIEDLVSLSLSISPDGSPSLSPRTARLQVPFTRATINNHYDPLNLVFRLILPEVLTFLAVLFVRLWPAAYVAHLQGTDVRRIILVITLNQSTVL